MTTIINFTFPMKLPPSKVDTKEAFKNVFFIEIAMKLLAIL